MGTGLQRCVQTEGQYKLLYILVLVLRTKINFNPVCTLHYIDCCTYTYLQSTINLTPRFHIPPHLIRCIRSFSWHTSIPFPSHHYSFCTYKFKSTFPSHHSSFYTYINPNTRISTFHFSFFSIVTNSQAPQLSDYPNPCSCTY